MTNQFVSIAFLLVGQSMLDALMPVTAASMSKVTCDVRVKYYRPLMLGELFVH